MTDQHSIYKNIRIRVPDTIDFDIDVVFPNGKTLQIQCRPSNASYNYNGSLDVILPDNQVVGTYFGNDLQKSKSVNCAGHLRLAQQLITELPYCPS
jgi:hypothetical protein